MICKKCNIDKSEEEFAIYKNQGRMYKHKMCKSCMLIRAREYYQRNAKEKRGYYWEYKEARLLYQKIHNQEPGVKRRRKEYYRKYSQEHKVDPKRLRHNKLISQYHITLKEYNNILVMQNGACAICNKAETSRSKSGTIKSLSVDHDHNCCCGEKTCGRCIRGLICDKCNQLLSRANDSIEILQSAITYLEKYEQNKIIKIA